MFNFKCKVRVVVAGIGPALTIKTMSDDFLAREQAILGGSFSPTGLDSSGGDVDFSASAFPDLDAFDGDAPIPSASARSLSNGLGDGFGDFETIPSMGSFNGPPPTDVKVTGDADLDQFESQFPDLDVVRDATFVFHAANSDSLMKLNSFGYL